MSNDHGAKGLAYNRFFRETHSIREVGKRCGK